MFRTLKRRFLPNPFDRMLQRCAKKKGKKILLGWNRGLGDIALGLFAMIERIRDVIPDAEIAFLTRDNLREGFSLLRDIQIIVDPALKRGDSIKDSLQRLKIQREAFDLVIEEPSPTDWVQWQRGSLTPKLTWDAAHEEDWKRFSLSPQVIYIGVQAVVETNYGKWRNWPVAYWRELFEEFQRMPNVQVILFGSSESTEFVGENLIDLRGKTTLYEMLSIVKNCCQFMILPDSGILSMVYYLNVSFPIHLISLWADGNHGILKQAVPSPNAQLIHTPLVGHLRDLSTVPVKQVLNTLFPVKALQTCPHAREIPYRDPGKVGVILLAGGQGSRLQKQGVKGCYPILGKTLFQRFCEKIPGAEIPIAIMTSPDNHEQTITYFEREQFFGKKISFFQQEMRPFLDEKKREMPLFLAPNGNGSVFRSFVQSTLLQQFKEEGIDWVTIIPIDNFLADPIHPELICYAREQKGDGALQCIQQKREDEQMGALVERGGRLEILEYHDQDPSSIYHYYNTGVMVLSLEFISRVAEKNLPVHFVKKRIPGTEKWGYKQETFIFDAFVFGQVMPLCIDRETGFFPIKTLQSIEEIESKQVFC